MTRLTEQHIHHISSSWDMYERKLFKETGYSLFEVACSALNLDFKKAKLESYGKKIAVIPLSSGEGYIPTFVESVKSICEHLGFIATIVEADEKGFQVFRQGDFDLAIWANDDAYFVENKNASISIDNNFTTGTAFAEVLHLMIKKACQKNRKIVEEFNSDILLEKAYKTVVIRGCGSIGTWAAYHLAQREYKVILYDIDTEKAKTLKNHLKDKKIQSKIIERKTLHMHLEGVMALLDAAPSPPQADEFVSRSFDYICAPCVPCLWKKEQGFWHDPLQLGTATMLLAATTDTVSGKTTL